MPNHNDARAFWVVDKSRGEIRSEQLAEPSATEVLIRTVYSGISRGTEALVFDARVPPSQYRRMRAPFQAGDFPAPVKYGYANVGRVEQGPPHLQGRAVFCLYPHQTRYIVPTEAVYPLPEEVPPERAILAANLETALNALWDAAPGLGDRIAVVGAGTVGSLIAWLAGQIPGCIVELIDIDPNKAVVADALRVRFAEPAKAVPDADLVIHTSASAEGLSTALSLAGFESTILEVSWYGDRQPAVPLGEAFHSRRLTLKASQVGEVAPSQRSRWTHRRRMELALTLLADSRLDVLITGQSAFEELPEVMRNLAANPRGALCHRIVY